MYESLQVVGRKTGVGYDILKAMARQGKIPAIRTPGGHWRADAEEIRRILPEVLKPQIQEAA